MLLYACQVLTTKSSSPSAVMLPQQWSGICLWRENVKKIELKEKENVFGAKRQKQQNKHGARWR
jgi:hypothetical protein